MKAAGLERLGGIILAGGASRRMGRDKATLPWRDVTVLEYLCKQFQPLSPLVVVGPQDRQLSAVDGVKLVYDDEPYAGPLAGMANGLACFPPEAAVLVTGCDYPLLTMGLVTQLHQMLNDAEAVVLMHDGIRQPFPGIYRATVLPTVERVLRTGQRSVQALLDAVVGCQAIPETTWQSWPEAAQQLMNINTPDEYQRAIMLFNTWNAP
jgi:molybdopterin-guanine dinucleotide biosynthesis protein A